MSEKEVEIKKFGEDTRVTLSVSTIAWILGILITIISTLATIGYFDIKSDVENQKEVFKKEKLEYKKEIRNLLKEELQYEREKREELLNAVGEIRGDIKVILEKTRNLENSHAHNTPSYTPPSHSTPDTSSVPVIPIH